VALRNTRKRKCFEVNLQYENLSVHALKNIPRRLNVKEMGRDFHIYAIKYFSPVYLYMGILS